MLYLPLSGHTAS